MSSQWAKFSYWAIWPSHVLDLHVNNVICRKFDNFLIQIFLISVAKITNWKNRLLSQVRFYHFKNVCITRRWQTEESQTWLDLGWHETKPNWNENWIHHPSPEIKLINNILRGTLTMLKGKLTVLGWIPIYYITGINK